MWIEFWSELANLIANQGLLTVALIVLVTSAGVPLPVPGGLLVVLVGARARDGETPLWIAWLVLTGASVVGATALFLFARWIGRETVLRFGQYIGLGEERLTAAEAWLREHGQVAIFVARIVPGLRTAIVVACGILDMSYRTFFVAIVLACMAYTGGFLLLGFVLGPPLIEMVERIVIPVGLLVPLAGLAILVIWIARARRSIDSRAVGVPQPASSRVRAGALAGALSMGGSNLLVNALVYLGGPLAELLLSAPGSIVTAAFRSRVDVFYLLGLLVGVTILGVIWGCIYAVEHAFSTPTVWPDWLHGVVFAALPLFMTLLWLTLVMITGPALPRTPWLTIAIGEAIGWAVYGALLGSIYPIFQARRALSTSWRYTS